MIKLMETENKILFFNFVMNHDKYITTVSLPNFKYTKEFSNIGDITIAERRV